MRIAALAAIVSFVVVSLSFADSGEKPSNAGFEKMKSLVGTWKGKAGNGNELMVTYRLVSAGHAIEETISHADMVTMYYEDGDKVMLTHYCAGNNQPRMRAAYKAGEKSMSFAFVDVTNLPDTNASHMHEVKFTFVDDNHMTTEWTNYNAGKPAGTIAFNIERAK